MKLIITVFLVLAVLGAAGFGVYSFISKSSSAKSSTDLETLIPKLTEPVSLTLTTTSPDDESLVFDKTLVVSGTTAPGAQVIISYGLGDTETDADGNGSFSKIIGLTPGLNYVYTTVFDKDGDSRQTKRAVYYSEEKL